MVKYPFSSVSVAFDPTTQLPLHLRQFRKMLKAERWRICFLALKPFVAMGFLFWLFVKKIFSRKHSKEILFPRKNIGKRTNQTTSNKAKKERDIFFRFFAFNAYMVRSFLFHPIPGIQIFKIPSHRNPYLCCGTTA